MSLNPGTHKVGPDNGSLQVHTFREGMAQKVGHDLIIEVEKWEATVEVGQDGAPAAITLDADAESLRVREGMHGLKPLSDKDLKDIHEASTTRSCASSRSRFAPARSGRAKGG